MFLSKIYHLILLFFLVLFYNTQAQYNTYQWPKVQSPIADKKPYYRTIHNDTVLDNYYWMIDYFKKGPDSAKIVNYLIAENNYLDTMMSKTKAFQQKLFLEMKNRIKEKDQSVPVFKNGYYYYTKTEEGKQYFKYCRKKGSLNAQEEVLLDVDEMAKTHPYYSTAGFSISKDNKLMAFAVDTLSRRQYTIYIKNLITDEIYKDAIHFTNGTAVWANDNQTLFYVKNHPATLLTEKVMRHKLGTEEKRDMIVYEEKDPSNYLNISKSKSSKFIYISSTGTLSSEIRFIDSNQPNAIFKVFQPRMKDILYQVYDMDDKFLIVTNWNAKNFRLMKCAFSKTDSASWKEVIANRTDILLENIEVFKNFLVISERKNGLIQLQIRNKAGQAHYLQFEEPAYYAYAWINPEYNSSILRYNYTSLSTPNSTFDYNMNTRKKQLIKQEKVLGGYDKEDYIIERLYATAKDGVKIPISLIYKKDFKKNGKGPVLLYGYGSYGFSMNASFNSTRLPLLNRGFAFAIAHIRGGQEMGRQWYEDGKMMKKKNTFTDFIDCAEYLIQQKYTSKKHLYAQGGSAGGLLMGAITNMRPDLWNGVIADVPFVDVVNTMLDETIPLTTNEFDEWGNPKNKDAYQYIKSYSPYENVENKIYPNLLITTGLHDSQVQYFEPAKWVAKLRSMKTDGNILLLHTNMDYGHGGASGRFDYLKNLALQFAFLFTLEGISN